MDIEYCSLPTEDIDFPENSFDVITACQCFWYFNHEQVKSKFFRMLKPDGCILILYMAWLPFEDKIAGESERLVLKYSPKWSGQEKLFIQYPYPIAIRKNLNWFIMRNIL